MSGESISAAGIEAGHTPGPWHVLNNGYCVGGPPSVQLADPIGAGVAMCCMAARSPDETAANARLIAAAPEMLVALKTIALHAPSLDVTGIRELCDAAIARAEGRA